MFIKNFLFALTLSALALPSSFAADEDGRCLRIAVRHCQGIAESFGSSSPQYYECVSKRQNRCIRSGR